MCMFLCVILSVQFCFYHLSWGSVCLFFVFVFLFLFMSVCVYVSLCDFACLVLLLPFVFGFCLFSFCLFVCLFFLFFSSFSSMPCGWQGLSALSECWA